MFSSVLAISLGAALGANARWLLGMALNPVFAGLPFGTLTANWVGSYLIGVALSGFNVLSIVSPELRLFVVTGFLGALTTFSSFSADIVALIQEGRFGWASAGILLHVAGSLIMTILGMLTVHLLRQMGAH
ncbi:fluoride efflux transporter CrcB [Parendozoicomonas sp. Alg238-R29]|uniref:fluoride efflux transporter CrcB n=1 Tax=Parendozoicomonas sp. Alg238-R29 TaxID=2993446 RepID=UPI00248EF1E1|nr:fluoride efflux transporter CrcB [Parendozoicomonas sp. Alg238-R29]